MINQYEDIIAQPPFLPYLINFLNTPTLNHSVQFAKKHQVTRLALPWIFLHFAFIRIDNRKWSVWVWSEGLLDGVFGEVIPVERLQLEGAFHFQGVFRFRSSDGRNFLESIIVGFGDDWVRVELPVEGCRWTRSSSWIFACIRSSGAWKSRREVSSCRWARGFLNL